MAEEENEQTPELAPAEPAAPERKSATLPRLSWEQIREVDDLHHETVDIPEWGGSVEVRSLTKKEWETYQDKDAPDDIHYLLSTALVAPEISEDEAAKMREKSITAVGRLEGAILEACGLGLSLEQLEARFLARAS